MVIRSQFRRTTTAAATAVAAAVPTSRPVRPSPSSSILTAVFFLFPPSLLTGLTQSLSTVSFVLIARRVARLGSIDESTRGEEAVEHVYYRCGVGIRRGGGGTVRIIVGIGIILPDTHIRQDKNHTTPLQKNKASRVSITSDTN